MSNVSKKVKATVIVIRDEMAYMVQRVVANMEEKMLSQIFYDKALEGVKKKLAVSTKTELSTQTALSRFRLQSL